MGKVGGEVETDLGRFEWSVLGVVATFPRKTATERLEPRVEGDGDHENLTEGMKECAEVALAEAVGEGKAQREENGNFGPNQRTVGWSEKKVEGCEEKENLHRLKKKESGKISVETGVKIFGKSFPDLAEAGVHPASDEGDGVTWVGAIEVKNFEARLAHISGDGDILDEMVTNGLVAFDFIVGSASKKNELAIGCTKTAERTWGPVREVEKDKKVNERNDEFLAPGEGFEVRPKREEISFLFMSEGDGLGDCAIGEAGVGVDKEEVFALGFLGKLVAGPRLSGPSFGKGLTGKESDTWVSLGSALNEGCGFVGGVIVENEDLHIRVVAVGDGADARGESEFLVTGWNEN